MKLSGARGAPHASLETLDLLGLTRRKGCLISSGPCHQISVTPPHGFSHLHTSTAGLDRQIVTILNSQAAFWIYRRHTATSNSKVCVNINKVACLRHSILSQFFVIFSLGVGNPVGPERFTHLRSDSPYQPS